ncbi:MAG: S49 family peptidase [Pseudomonadota bacterium]
MPHEIDRILRALSSRAWFVEPRKGDEIVALLALRAQGHTLGMEQQPRPAPRRDGAVAVLPLIGSIMPRADAVSESSGAVSLARWGQRFRELADDPRVSAIVLEVDSPGGAVDLVPETAAMIRAARREDRPIIAVASTTAASAAYWIASAADELVVTPSGEVGSIGVYMMHRDLSAALEAEGVAVTLISEGPRKIEGHPFAPLDDVARAALQRQVGEMYARFTADVAKARGVPRARVTADPERAERHFGGGRTVGAEEAVRLGMADRVATLDETIERLRTPRGRRRR